MDDIISSDEVWEESDYRNPPNTNTDSFFKPYLDAHEKMALEKRMNGAKRNIIDYTKSFGKSMLLLGRLCSLCMPLGLLFSPANNQFGCNNPRSGWQSDGGLSS
ncbi:hypothetical protein Tco_1284800 [Tanacetum coccineum]